jgi:hypothetical protein
MGVGRNGSLRITGGNVDPALKALCLEVIDGDVDSERFAWLLIETGINIDSFEWDVANKLLERGEFLEILARKWGNTIH